MSDRISRKAKKLKTKSIIKKRDGKCDFENTSDKGAHKERTYSREMKKLMTKHFGFEK